MMEKEHVVSYKFITQNSKIEFCFYFFNMVNVSVCDWLVGERLNMQVHSELKNYSY